MEKITVEPRKCLPCDRNFNFQEEFLVKMPEGACFCMPFIEKYPDPTEYKEEGHGWLSLTFLPGMTITNDIGENHT